MQHENASECVNNENIWLHNNYNWINQPLTIHDADPYIRVRLVDLEIYGMRHATCVVV